MFCLVFFHPKSSVVRAKQDMNMFFVHEVSWQEMGVVFTLCLFTFNPDPSASVSSKLLQSFWTLQLRFRFSEFELLRILKTIPSTGTWLTWMATPPHRGEDSRSNLMVLPHFLLVPLAFTTETLLCSSTYLPAEIYRLSMKMGFHMYRFW